MFIENTLSVFMAHREANEFRFSMSNRASLNGAINVGLLTEPLRYNLPLARFKTFLASATFITLAHARAAGHR